MFKKLAIAVLALFMGLTVYNESSAQSYATSAGLRLGVSNGLTVKHFIKENTALEGIIHTRYRGVILTGLFEIHKDINEVKGLRWFYGGGGHVGFWGSSIGRYNDRYGNTTIIGIDGIIGLDYLFEDFPLNVSLDYKPAFNLTGRTGFWGTESALSVRYAF
ncbi:MAG: hypothetical protein WDZ72_05535 [Cyclobacteriaceae bacterium]